jgi:hypothetical protein
MLPGKSHSEKHVLFGGNFLTHPQASRKPILIRISETAGVISIAHVLVRLLYKFNAPSKLALTFSSWGGLGLSPIARIDRAHSDRARSASRRDRPDYPSRFHHFQSRIEFMPAGRATNAIRFDRKFV